LAFIFSEYYSSENPGFLNRVKSLGCYEPTLLERQMIGFERLGPQTLAAALFLLIAWARMPKTNFH
jgi:hypothetical protein